MSDPTDPGVPPPPPPGAPFSSQTPPPPPFATVSYGGPPPDEPTDPIPWERPGSSFPQNLFDTLTLFLGSPRRAYERTPRTAGMGRPIFYALIVGTFGTIATAIYQIVFRGVLTSFLPESDYSTGAFALETFFEVWGMFFAPVLILFGLFVEATLCHLFLLLLGGASAGYSGSVRATAYAHSPAVVQIVPLVGAVVYAIWSLVLQIRGLSIIHRCSIGKAIVAVFAPALLCCACFFWFFMFVFAAIFAAAGGGNS